MTATDLEALLERVNAAGGPDRELDCILHALLTTGATHIQQIGDAIVAKQDNGIGTVLGWVDPGETNRNFTAHNKLDPPYTASIDAALALVERLLPGWVAQIRGYGRYAATVLLYLPTVPFKDAPTGDSGTLSRPMPLAILAALLTALLAQHKGTETK